MKYLIFIVLLLGCSVRPVVDYHDPDCPREGICMCPSGELFIADESFEDIVILNYEAPPTNEVRIMTLDPSIELSFDDNDITITATYFCNTDTCKNEAFIYVPELNFRTLMGYSLTVDSLGRTMYCDPNYYVSTYYCSSCITVYTKIEHCWQIYYYQGEGNYLSLNDPPPFRIIDRTPEYLKHYKRQ